MNPIRVFVYPQATGPDLGEGGVGRIIRMQQEYMSLPHYSGVQFELADSIETCDVIACHITIPSEFISKYPNIPIAGHVHGMYWDSYKWAKGHYMINREVSELIRLADTVTGPSEWVSRVIRQQYQRQCATVYHAVDIDEWQAVPKHNKVTIDRETEVPGAKWELENYVFFDKTRRDPICETDSLAQVARLLPDIQFVSTAPVDFASDNVIQIGRVPYDVARFVMRNARAYLATTRETFGVSNLQALAAGVPIAGFDWGGQREIQWAAEGAQKGWVRLATPDDISSLAANIEAIYRDDSHLDEEDALALCGKFPIEKAMELYQNSWLKAYLSHKKYEDKPDVSVIITAYGLDKYLPAAIDSVLSQSGVNLECIIVDDSSSDNCGAIGDEYAAKDNRVVSLHTPRNLYLAGARNWGINKAAGRYILPLDADDKLPQLALETLVSALDKDRTIDIAYGNVLFEEEDGRLWNSGWPIKWRAVYQVDGKNCLPYSSMYRRRVFDTIGGYRTRCHTAEDADFWLRSALAGFRAEMVTSADTLQYLNRSGSMSHTIPTPKWQAWSPRQLPAGLATGEPLPIPALDPPVIAVVIPVGDGHSKYLFDALDSVYSQSFINWECIVVDDTVTDCLPGNLPAWARVVRAGGLGVATARNIGIEVAQARMFVPLDADDMLQPNALDVMYAAYIDSGRESIVYSDWWEDWPTENQFTVWQTPDYNPRYFIEHGAMHAVTALTPKRYWKELGGYDASLFGWEDWSFQLACAAAGYPSRRVPLPLLTYRKHTGFRREQNQVEYEKSKASILERYGEYWEGKPFMSCSCNKRTTDTFAPGGGATSEQGFSSIQEGAQLVTYEPLVSGRFTIRGTTGASYRFEGGETRYVLDADVPAILSIVGFALAKPKTPVFSGAEPELSVLVESGRR